MPARLFRNQIYAQSATCVVCLLNYRYFTSFIAKNQTSNCHKIFLFAPPLFWHIHAKRQAEKLCARAHTGPLPQRLFGDVCAGFRIRCRSKRRTWPARSDPAFFQSQRPRREFFAAGAVIFNPRFDPALKRSATSKNCLRTQAEQRKIAMPN